MVRQHDVETCIYTLNSLRQKKLRRTALEREFRSCSMTLFTSFSGSSLRHYGTKEDALVKKSDLLPEMFNVKKHHLPNQSKLNTSIMLL